MILSRSVTHAVSPSALCSEPPLTLWYTTKNWRTMSATNMKSITRLTINHMSTLEVAGRKPTSKGVSSAVYNSADIVIKSHKDRMDDPRGSITKTRSRSRCFNCAEMLRVCFLNSSETTAGLRKFARVPKSVDITLTRLPPLLSDDAAAIFVILRGAALLPSRSADVVGATCAMLLDGDN